jgi:hypothetical protein
LTALPGWGLGGPYIPITRHLRAVADQSMLKLVPGRPMRSHQLSLPRTWLITSMLSIAIAVGGYALGKAVDCKPGQIDGQCGLGTFLGPRPSLRNALLLSVSPTLPKMHDLTGTRKIAITSWAENGASVLSKHRGLAAMKSSWQTDTGNLSCRWSEVGQRVQYDSAWIQEMSVVQSGYLPPVPDFASHSPLGSGEWFVPWRLRWNVPDGRSLV